MAMAIACLSALSTLSHAAPDDGYSAGRDFGNAIRGNANSALNSGQAQGVIPGTTGSPPETRFYGGVTSSNTNLQNEGMSALLGTEHGKAALEAYTQNPKPTLSMDADFLKPGWEAQANAEKVLDGSQQCTSQTLQKTSYDNYYCIRDPSITSSCKKIATVGGNWTNTQPVPKYLILTPADFAWTRTQSTHPGGTLLLPAFRGVYALPLSGQILAQSIQLLGSARFWSIKAPNGYVKPTFYQPGMPAFSTFYPSAYNEGTLIELTITKIPDAQGDANNPGDFRLYLNLAVDERQFVPEVIWQNFCPSEVVTADVTCTQGPETRSIVMEGKTYSIHSDCWEYTTQIREQEADDQACAEYDNNKNCTLAARNCEMSDEEGVCVSEKVTYQCQTTASASGQLCGGDFYCTDGACDTMANNKNSSFAHAISQLATVSAAAETAVDQIDIQVGAFTGQGMQCRKAAAGFNNCCANGGWGASAGFAHCSSEEKNLGTAKERKLAISVGEFCAKKVLGVCIQKKRSYCVFESKLAKILQEQGRAWQLGIGFGSGKRPNCRAITIEELQQIDFSKLDFKDFYEDLQNNLKLPDIEALTEQIKNQIAAEAERLGQ
ncbi:conjugal transfer protein TraN [Pseudomonas sp. P5_152]|uniref:conjugal transfer protein TraN n=1 Tax=Pseudomonas sp. P5_152 TaxID=3043442 RepID=UPI002A35A40D|nr:conjugal transfer protein TraN [Pseudomonas sp. P5_152]MDX9668641.1 conjugal transfer protein TraN [Pseudomonas sp. P5_152]